MKTFINSPEICSYIPKPESSVTSPIYLSGIKFCGGLHPVEQEANAKPFSLAKWHDIQVAIKPFDKNDIENLSILRYY